MQKKSLLLTLVLLLTCTLFLSASSIESCIDYTGYLTDDLDAPLHGTYELVFSLYIAEDDLPQENMWTEPHVSVVITEGNYTVRLGSQGTPLPVSLFSKQLWLGVARDGVEKRPLIKLAPVSYAMTAKNAEDVAGRVIHPDAVYTGDVTTYSMSAVTIDTDSLRIRGKEVLVDEGTLSINDVKVNDREIITSDIINDTVTIENVDSVDTTRLLSKQLISEQSIIEQNGVAAVFLPFDSYFSLEAYASGDVSSKKSLVFNPYGGMVGIGTIMPEFALEVVAAHNWRGIGIRQTSTDANSGAVLNLMKGTIDSPTLIDHMIGGVEFDIVDSNLNFTQVAGIYSKATNVTDGAESGQILFHTRNNGVWASRMMIDQDGDVMIGEGAPTAKLEVQGTVKAEVVQAGTLEGLFTGEMIYAGDKENNPGDVSARKAWESPANAVSVIVPEDGTYFMSYHARLWGMKTEDSWWKARVYNVTQAREELATFGINIAALAMNGDTTTSGSTILSLTKGDVLRIEYYVYGTGTGTLRTGDGNGRSALNILRVGD